MLLRFLYHHNKAGHCNSSYVSAFLPLYQFIKNHLHSVTCCEQIRRTKWQRRGHVLMFTFTVGNVREFVFLRLNLEVPSNSAAIRLRNSEFQTELKEH